MKVHIRNIGMLDEADFEVGDLTLICGENNTGKTYATYSLYGYLDFMRSIREGIFIRIRRDIDESIFDFTTDKEIKFTFEKIKERLDKHIKTKEDFYFKLVLFQMMAGKREDFENTEYNVEINFSISEIKDATKKYLENNEINSRAKKIFQHTLYDDGLSILNNRNIDIRHYVESFLDSLLNILLMKNFILSVERTGASIFQKELDFSKIAKLEAMQKMFKEGEDIEIFSIRKTLDSKKQLYPKPVRDNIDFIRDLELISKQESIFKERKEYYKTLLNLLVKLANGKYKIADSGILFQPRGSKKAYNIEVASSSVRSLLMLNYYILHEAQKGDILMIDEPELNLHPNNQILIARLLVLLVNAGIKVFITTHSDYIVRELSNCIMLNNLSDEQLNKFKKQGYSKEYKLESNKVKAYLAKNIKGKNTLKEVEITKEQGIFMETFDEPIDSQNENQGLIFEEVMRTQRKDDDK